MSDTGMKRKLKVGDLVMIEPNGVFGEIAMLSNKKTLGIRLPILDVTRRHKSYFTLNIKFFKKRPYQLHYIGKL